MVSKALEKDRALRYQAPPKSAPTSNASSATRNPRSSTAATTAVVPPRKRMSLANKGDDHFGSVVLVAGLALFAQRGLQELQLKSMDSIAVLPIVKCHWRFE